jgi:uncharacterized protein (TIGR03546 family)
MLKLINPLRFLWKAISSERTANQIAWGIALGILVGIVPKGNLTAWLFGMVLLATKVNLGVGMLTAILVSSINAWTDPLTHAIGMRLLKSPEIQNLLVRWSDKPLVPWLALNNTIVLGSATLGLAVLYPAKHLSWLLIELVTGRIQAVRGLRTPANEPRTPSDSETSPRPTPATEV